MRPRRPRDTIFQAYERIVDRFARRVAERMSDRLESFVMEQAKGLGYLPGEDPYGDRNGGSGYRSPPRIDGGSQGYNEYRQTYGSNQGRYERASGQAAALCPNCRVPIYRMGAGIFLCARCRGQFFVLNPRPSFQNPGQWVGDETPEWTDGRSRAPDEEAPFSGRKKRTRRANGYAYAPHARPNPKRRGRKKAAPPPPPEPTVEELLAAAYKLLGLDIKGTAIDDVKQKRRELAQKYHPDHGGDAERFKDINAAADLVIAHLEKMQRH